MSLKIGIRTCRNKAIDRSNKINQDKRQRIVMVATLLKGGAVIDVATNDYRRLSFPFKRVNQYRSNAGQHAEIALINKCTKKQLKDATIIVYGIAVGQNIDTKPPIENTKPCPNCCAAIKAVGIRKICYIENGQFVTKKVSEIDE